MYRIFITKLSTFGLKHKCCSGPSRFHKFFRQYSSKSEKQICPPPHKKHTSGAIYTIGVLTLVGGGAIGYAKYDCNFREWLDCNVPYSDDFIKVLFQEDKTYAENFVILLDTIKESFLNLTFGIGSRKLKNIPEKPIDYSPPSPAFTELAEHKEPDHYTEIRLEKKKKEDIQVTIGGVEKIKEELVSDTHPKSIHELETKIAEGVLHAVCAYNKAVFALKNYNADVEIVIEESVDRLEPSIWESLRQKTKTKDKTIKQAENCAKETIDNVSKLRDILKDPCVDAPEVLKQRVELNMQKVISDIDEAKVTLKKAQADTNITEKYWKKVEDARSHFIDEIEILFPGVNISEKKLELQGGELDLFILHAFSNVLYYQKELLKLQVIEQQKLRVALDNARRGNKDILTDAQVKQLVEKEKTCLAEEYQKKCLCLRAESEKQLRRQLKLQSEAFADHLSEALKTREKELERDFARHLDEKVTAEKCKFKLQLSALAGRVRGMDKAFKDRLESDKILKQSQVLWSSCQALFRSLRATCPGIPWIAQLRPLEPEINAVQKAAAENDELVKMVLKGIPTIAFERGVFSEEALRERFLKVEKVVRHVALVPDGGCRLPLHLLSFIHSLLLLKSATPIPQAELDDDPVDFSGFSTNDILQRARYWIDRGDFAQTLRYMNLLDGAPRCLAQQWMEETRVLLETQQAANILMAHAAANGLLHL